MKKLRLKALSLGAREILSREQLKRVIGGGCQNANDCPLDYFCDLNGVCEYSGIPDGSTPSTASGTGCDYGYVKCDCTSSYSYDCVATQQECLDLRSANPC